MSATGRGAKRRDADYYPTPAGATLAILRALDLPGGLWLEPAAGEGAIIRAVNSVRDDVRWTACELRAECTPFLRSVGVNDLFTGDFLGVPFTPIFKVAILNPPFSAALPFIDRCLGLADWIVCLERINWIASQTRNRWFREHAPDMYVLSNRPSFIESGKTDMAEYAWFVWPPGEHDRSHGRVEVLDAAPGQVPLFGAAQ